MCHFFVVVCFAHSRLHSRLPTIFRHIHASKSAKDIFSTFSLQKPLMYWWMHKGEMHPSETNTMPRKHHQIRLHPSYKRLHTTTNYPSYLHCGVSLSWSLKPLMTLLHQGCIRNINEQRRGTALRKCASTHVQFKSADPLSQIRITENQTVQ